MGIPTSDAAGVDPATVARFESEEAFRAPLSRTSAPARGRLSDCVNAHVGRKPSDEAVLRLVPRAELMAWRAALDHLAQHGVVGIVPWEVYVGLRGLCRRGDMAQEESQWQPR